MAEYDATHYNSQEFETPVVADQIAAQQGSNTITWLKRGLVVGAIAGIAYGGVESVIHFDDVKSDITSHDAWAAPALAITEGMAWGGTIAMVGSMGAKKSFRNVTGLMKDLPGHMRDLEGSKLFQAGMKINIVGAVGTSAVFAAGAEALPESARPLAYGVAAGSIALSSIPIKAAYMLDKRKHKES